MARVYEKAAGEVATMVQNLIDENYPDIAEAALEIGLRAVSANRNEEGDVTAPAILVRGRKAYASVKLVSTKDRVFTGRDVVIDIDQDEWETMDAEKQLAILDHQLAHIEVQRDSDTGTVLTADDNRPSLKLKIHDIEIGGFWNVIGRHGIRAVEASHFSAAAEIMYDKYGQAMFPFMGEGTKAVKKSKAKKGRQTVRS